MLFTKNARKISELSQEINRLHTKLLKERAKITSLLKTIREMDDQIFRISQCQSFDQIRPHLNNLAEGMMIRKRIESDRISDLIVKELEDKCDE